MELFSVRRYDDGAAAQPEQSEGEILQKLLKKAEKRKKKKHAAEEVIETESPKKSKVKNEEDTVKLQEEIEANQDPIGATEEQYQEENDANAKDGDAGGFEVLGNDADFKKRQQVAMVLPPWLANPTIVSMDMSEAAEAETISELSYLTPETRAALKEMNVTRLFPVQKATIPWILNAHHKPPPYRPRDACVSAPTGSGKTLAFAIPVVQILSKRVQPKIRALVVLPVTELALQVFKVFKKLCEKTSLTVCLLSTQFPFPIEQEKLVGMHRGQYYSKVDIVVTTPGRLVDHLHSTKGFCLKALRFLVIDEADRIMDAVFQNWIYHLDEHVRDTTDQLLLGRSAPLCYHELVHSARHQPHKLLFSATLSQDPEKLQNLRLFQPKLFTSVMTNVEELHAKFSTQQSEEAGRGEFIGKYTTPKELTEKYCITENRLKPLTLYTLIKENAWKKYLCFTNSVESAGRLAFVLSKLVENSQTIAELSGSLQAKERASVLNKFSRGQVNGLICSDALARGIDIPNVDIIISYDAPRHVKTYIHRIGRTARAGRPGTAITLLNEKELQFFNQSLAQVGKRLVNEISVSTTMEVEYAATYSHALTALRLKLEKDKRSKLLLKERTKATNSALPNKAPEEMTLMEKLQVQVHKHTINRVKENANQELKKENTNIVPKRKKFNASAAKNQKIVQ